LSSFHSRRSGSHEHRLDEGFDVRLAGVVGAQLRCAGLVQRALEEGAEDAGLDELPVRFRGVGQGADLLRGELEHGGLLEQVAVEVADLARAEGAAPRHDLEQLLQPLGEEVRDRPARLVTSVKVPSGSRPTSSAKKQKMMRLRKRATRRFLLHGHVDLGPAFGVVVFDALPLWSERATLGDLLRQLLGDAVGGAREGRSRSGSVNRQRSLCRTFGLVELVVGELDGFLHRAVEVGADDVAVEVAHHEQGRVERATSR
jgi:hypothetical protein